MGQHARCRSVVNAKQPPRVEALEARSLLACVLGSNAGILDGTLTIEGTNKNDAIHAERVDSGVVADSSDDSLTVSLNGKEVANCLLTDVTKLRIFGANGNDEITVADGVGISCEINGGNGNDSLEGGDGDDTIIGDNGKDNIDGDDGNDLLQGGNGKDTIQGGAGNDVLQGGTASDTLNDPDGDQGLNGGPAPDIINGVAEPAPNRGHGRPAKNGDRPK